MLENEKKLFPLRLKELRGDMPQQQFAESVGVKQSAYSNWERGAMDPASSNIILIAKKFNVRTDWLLGLCDEKFIEMAKKPEKIETPTANGTGSVAFTGGVSFANGGSLGGAGNNPPDSRMEELQRQINELGKDVEKIKFALTLVFGGKWGNKINQLKQE